MDNGTTLPRERLNIVCKTGDDEAETELPLRMLFVGDYMGRDERPVDERLPVRIDRDSFAKVLAAHGPTLDLVVSSARSNGEGTGVRASLAFRELSDFGPDAVAEQIPEVARLLAVRDALTELKSSGDVAAFRTRLETVVEDAPARTRLLAAVGLAALEDHAMLRERFELEADALWAHLQHLARRAPRLEGLYARDADPRVARLVQSAAFAFSTAHDRLHDDGQALVRPLVARALPESLRPRPSSTILELSPSSGRSGPVRETTFGARVGQTRVPFQIVWPATLAPMALEDVVLDRLDARRQVLRFALAGRSGASLGVTLPDAVRLYVHFEPRSVALDLVHALRSCRRAARMKSFDAKKELLGDRELRGAVRWVRVDTDEAPLVSARADRFRSSSLLADLFAFPESFCFFDLHLGKVDRRAERLELVLPLAHVVNGASLLSGNHLRLFCAPATNQFVTAIEPVASTGASGATLSAAGKPHAEILEVRGLSTVSIRDAGRRTPLRSWEAPDAPRTFDPAETHFVLEQRPAARDGRTELRATFGRLDAFPAAPGGVVEGEVLACDGALTSSLGLGEIGSARDGAKNISRVTPSRRALLGHDHAWRMSAYARMPPARLAEHARLTEFLRLHDPVGMQDEASRVERPRLLATEHVREHDLADGVLAWGDCFTLDVEASGCSDGELWLLGALIHRAIAERTEALRFTRLILRRGGAPFAEYEPRAGARLPFPLG